MEQTQQHIESFLQKYPIISMNEMLSHELSNPTFQDPIWNIVKYKDGEFPFSKNLIQGLATTLISLFQKVITTIR